MHECNQSNNSKQIVFIYLLKIVIHLISASHLLFLSICNEWITAVDSIKTFFVVSLIFEWSPLIIGGSEHTIPSESVMTGYTGESRMIGKKSFICVSFYCWFSKKYNLRNWSCAIGSKEKDRVPHRIPWVCFRPSLRFYREEWTWYQRESSHRMWKVPWWYRDREFQWRRDGDDGTNCGATCLDNQWMSHRLAEWMSHCGERIQQRRGGFAWPFLFKTKITLENCSIPSEMEKLRGLLSKK